MNFVSFTAIPLFSCQHKTKVRLKQSDNMETDWKQMRGAFFEHYSGAELLKKQTYFLTTFIPTSVLQPILSL